VPQIFQYLDYREYLRDYYEERKVEQPFFSYRYFAQKIQLDPGTLLKITRLKAHLSSKSVSQVLAYLKLSSQESMYFETMVSFGKAKTSTEHQKFYEELLKIKDLDSHTISDMQYLFFSEWYHIPIRAIIGMGNIRNNYEDIASGLTPSIPVEKVQESIQMMQRLGLVKQNDNGEWEVTDSALSTGNQWTSHAIRQYQKDVITKAMESIDRHAKKDRDISTVTVSLNQKDLPLFRRRCEEFRKELMKMALDSEDPDSVYQINLQLFPMGFRHARN